MKTLSVNTTSGPVSNLWLSGLLGGVVAFVGALALFGIAALLNIPLEVGAAPDQATLMRLSVTQLLFATGVPAIVGTLLYAMLRLVFKQNAARIFQVIAVIVLLVSFGGPLSLAVSTANKLILALMHVVATAAIVWALTRRK